MKKKQKRITVARRIFKSFMNLIDNSVRNILLILVLFFAVGQWLQIDFLGKLRTKIDIERPLAENEEGRISGDIRAKRIILQQKGKKTKIYEGVRKFEATQFTDGDVKIKVKNKGLVLEPGFLLGAGESMRIGGDIQYAYWKRWGLTVGGTVPTYSRRIDLFRGHLGISYAPYLSFIPHTSVFGGIDSNKSPVFGIRTEF